MIMMMIPITRVNSTIYQSKLKIIVTIFLLFFVFVDFDTSAAESSDWYLISRHGQCTEIKVLERKVTDLGDVTSPDRFVNLMNSRGYTVVATEIPELKGDAVRVNVPAKGLSVIFVRKLLCKGFVGE